MGRIRSFLGFFATLIVALFVSYAHAEYACSVTTTYTECASGWYLDNATCKECPAGWGCAGGTAKPKMTINYWPNSSSAYGSTASTNVTWGS